jgi:flagellar assembly protein FliH
MNSSFSQPEPSIDPGVIQDFVYQQVIGSDPSIRQSFRPNIFGADPEQEPPQEAAAGETSPPAPATTFTEEELQRHAAQAHERGLNAGREEIRAAAQQSIEEAQKQITRNLNSFAQERDLYFRNMEAEIVELALAVARKVLHREAQVDKVVLAGVVRVALEKIAGTGQIALHVHPSASEAWKQYVSDHHDMAVVPEIIADSSLNLDQLVLKTAHGNTELGIGAQLKEIEKGFTDLVQQKKRSMRQ